jgi:ABC-2 type transport system permease protein
MLALLDKELIDQRRNLALFLPAILVGVLAILLPVFVAVIVPAVTGERLADSSDFQVAIELYRQQPQARALGPEGAVQAYIFQQFLVMLLLIPVTSAMSVAAFSVVGEKQARSLEPLLVTPITTIELLGAKVLGALLPSLVLSGASLAAYLLVVAAFAEPGVIWLLVGPRSLATIFLLGPLAAMAALQMAVCVSSRVSDARTAQQIGALVILPIAGLFIAQVFGAVELSVPLIVVVAAGLAVFNAGLAWVAIVLFDREAVLTRWK